VIDARHDQIVKLRQAGLSYAKIGRSLGISRERVRQILQGKRTREKLDLRSKAVLRGGEVASLLGVHMNTVRRWSDKGVLKSFRVGLRHERRFRREDVDAFLEEEGASRQPHQSEPKSFRTL